MWLFGKRTDLWAFGGSALVALLLALVAEFTGFAEETPTWAWLVAIVLVDVAHVWSTVFRTYLDGAELRRHPVRYALVPFFAWLAGVFAYAWGPMVFWTALAYAAVFHFVRQQYGWVQLYRRKAGEDNRWSRRFDGAVIYAATLYPLIYWHAHLPRNFHWFMPGDFQGIPGVVAHYAEPVYWGLMAVYGARATASWLGYGVRNYGKDLVVVTTAACWYVGIVALNSDFAFAVTNVLIHGVPYFVLVYHHEKKQSTVSMGRLILRKGWPFYLGLLWLLALGEEALWDRTVWHERSWLFGSGWEIQGLLPWLVPLLAVPQLSHYFLDGFIWRRREMASD